jgi:hypothetical protein
MSTFDELLDNLEHCSRWPNDGEIPHAKKLLRAMYDYAVVAERERCAVLCDGAREAASHASDGLKRVGAMSMAASCAELIRTA